MAADFYGNALIASDRARARHLEAKLAGWQTHRISKKGQNRHSVLKDAGQTLNRVIQIPILRQQQKG
jgi:hypothetical protein